ncbi:MAG: UpxY family transcription antiterminator [Bacteroidota bacterium]|nr:UpxY family transcription antiterminator [Bacteroidota bacterium]
MEQVNQKQWMALYTKPRNEQKVNEKIESMGFESYLPMQESIRQWSDRKKKIKTPLFTSYVFVKVDEKERLEVKKVPGVLNFVYWLGKPAIIQDIEIERIRYFLKEAGTHIVLIEQLMPGDKGVINSGEFKDEKVQILQTTQKEYITIIESLGIKLRLSKMNVTAKHKL